jgi:hypothetical protein
MPEDGVFSPKVREHLVMSTISERIQIVQVDVDV